ncbi:Protein of unknown function [Saccharicrinis carchari]|uniref:DUF4199 domain-containing protein n=1 Tax=Saccharicrinis carchari TaxID=1168039 RepID=A0A521ERP4_SACCC|nr:DUF4199 domain-containing protein [Saccharicrinis carchari]SMO86091.1 Protein of unknown function [Saccharicrinis carchari]
MEQSASKSSTVYTYGLYLGIAAIVFSLITYYGGMLGNTYFGYLGFVISIVFIYLGLKAYKENENGGYLKYGQGVGIGVLISLVGGIVSSIFTFVFFAFIDPAKHTEMMAIVQEQQLEAGVPAAQLEQMDGMMSAMMSPTAMAIYGVIGSVIGGLIISLIIAAILKKDPEPEF